MKKRLVTMIAGVCALALLGGCAGGSISNENITIKKYKGIEVEKEEEEKVTDEMVKSSIQAELMSLIDRPAQMGDTTIIDYSGKKDGVAFEGGTAQYQQLVLGSNSFIDGFEEGIVGKKVGETFDLNLTFPEQYHSAELAGQDVVFTVTLQGILVEPTDEHLELLNTSAKTMEEHMAQVRKDLKKSNEESAVASRREKAITALIEQCEVKDYPKDMTDEKTALLVDAYVYLASMNGMQVEKDTLFEQYPDLEKEVKETAKNMIKEELAVALVAEKAKLELSDDEYKTRLEEQAKLAGFDAEGFEEAYNQSNGEDAFRKSVLKEKVADYILEHCVEVEKKEEK